MAYWQRRAEQKLIAMHPSIWKKMSKEIMQGGDILERHGHD